MSSVLPTPPLPHLGIRHEWARWAPVIAGLLALYLPTLYDLHATTWNEEEHAHGPIVLLIVLWLAWQKRDALLETREQPALAAGAFSIALGLALYVVGRSQAIIMFEVASAIPLLAGVVMALKGVHALARLWFVLLFLVFLIPLPGVLVDSLTGPLKQQVSVVAEHLLYAVGYPIARNGVVLSVGQYQLLVADACSGLNSMYSLAAMGLLYLYLMRYRSVLRNALLVAGILPIAFAANIVRVLILVLVTYHFGDAAGQGFVHGFAGILVFVSALLMLVALDALLGAFFFRKARA